MKKIALTLSIACICLTGFSSDKFIKSMEQTLSIMDTASTMKSFQQIANRFERIAGAEKDKWLPYYWAAYNYVVISYQEQHNNKKDEYLDKAQELIEKAQKLDSENDEIYILQGWIYSARIGINPMVRGAKYGPKSSAMLDMANKLNPDNPRYYYLKGTNMFYTPAQWGGGKDKARPLLEEAVGKYKTFKPESGIHPNWGGKKAAELLGQCEEGE